MKKELKEFLDEAQKIYLEIWDYGHREKEYPIHCDRVEDLTSIKLEIYSEDFDYLTGAEIETCVKIANSHQETCFNAWSVQTTNIVVETKKGHMVTVQTPILVIRIYQRHKEETEQ